MTDRKELNLYSDVMDAGLVQPYKPVYGKADLKKVMKRYPEYSEDEAKWILVCSAAYHWKSGKECRVTRSIN